MAWPSLGPQQEAFAGDSVLTWLRADPSQPLSFQEAEDQHFVHTPPTASLAPSRAA